MSTVRPYRADDREIWDQFVREHPCGGPYHLRGWSEAVQQTYGHRSVDWIAVNDGRCEGVLPLIEFRSSVSAHRQVSVPFCDFGGPLAASAETASLLTDRAVEDCRSRGNLGLELRCAEPLEACSGAAWSLRESDKVRMILPLPSSAEELLASFKAKLRSQVRKAEKNGVEFRWAESEEIAEFYSVFSRNMRDLGSPVHHVRLFESLFEHAAAYVKLGLVCCEGRTIGGGLLFSVGDRISIPWASTLRECNHLAPNMLLYWNFLRFAADSGFRQFDFGRSTVGEGTYRFKRQWGAAPKPLAWYAHTAGAARSAATAPTGPSRLRGCAEGAWRHLPLVLANWMGPKLRRHIDL